MINNESRILRINFVSNIITYGTSLVINYFLTSFISENLGTEAYGFVSLANIMVNYLTLITIALNSMASRFVTVSYHKGELEKANNYYTSVFYGNILLSLIILIPSCLILLYIEKLINIPLNLVYDVKILMLLLFLNLFLSLNANLFSIAMFVKNKLFLTSLLNIGVSLLRGILLLYLFTFLVPKIYYIGIASLLVTSLAIIWNMFFSKRIMPEITLNKKYFDFHSIKIIISAGVWNSIIRLGNLLLEGVDLLITNLFIGVVEMGILAIAKAIPNIITSFIFSLSNVYLPNLTKAYAQGETNEIRNILNKSISVLGLFANIPLVVLFVLGDSFYGLWLPSQNSEILRNLSMITVASFVVNGSISAVYCGFSIANKLKKQSIVVVISGIISTLMVLLLINTTQLGLYAVAGVSSVVSIIRDLTFGLPYASIHLKQKWYTFYPSVIKNIVAFILDVILVYYLKYLFYPNSWIELCFLGSISLMICVFVNFIIFTTQKGKKALFAKIINLITKNR